jgi:hypothetical protein
MGKIHNIEEEIGFCSKDYNPLLVGCDDYKKGTSSLSPEDRDKIAMNLGLKIHLHSIEHGTVIARLSYLFNQKMEEDPEFWLPVFLTHECLALRKLAKDHYEKTH